MSSSPRDDLHRPPSFAYRVPNISGGLVVNKIEQRTDGAARATA